MILYLVICAYPASLSLINKVSLIAPLLSWISPTESHRLNGFNFHRESQLSPTVKYRRNKVKRRTDHSRVVTHPRPQDHRELIDTPVLSNMEVDTEAHMSFAHKLPKH